MKPKMKAYVIQNMGRTTHHLVRLMDGIPVPTFPFPRAARVEITEEVGAYYLIRYDSTDDFCGDTWHQSLEAAQRQAEFEFGIARGDWELVEDETSMGAKPSRGKLS